MFDDDGMMLNIQLKSNMKSSQTSTKTKKNDLKKMKYSQKLKQKSTIVRSISNKTINQFENQRPIKRIRKDDLKIDKQQNGDKQQKNLTYEEQETIPAKRSKNNYKRPYEDRYQRKYPQKSTFTPESRIQVNVQELLPEQLSITHKNMDTNQIEGFNLQSRLKSSLLKSEVSKLTDIQLKCFKTLFQKKDAVVKAATGSGKTLAYLIPIINTILAEKTIKKREDGLKMLIICPTRQLCLQGQKQTLRCLKKSPFIVTGSLFGGQQTNHEKSRLRKGTNILFCTPGRLLYHLEKTQSFKVDNLKHIIFQQADRTLDMGFEESVDKILNKLTQKSPLVLIQKILVSAHFNSKVSNLIDNLEMNNPIFIGFDPKDDQQTQNLNHKEMTIQKLRKRKDYEINASDKLKQQYILISEDQKIPIMLSFLGVLKQCKVLIFVNTIDEVQFLDYLLTNLKFKDSNGVPTDIKFENRPVYKIHGNLDQKLRSNTYLQFRASKSAIMISTQVASRGLDFPDLSHIILFDVPPTITDYGNRVGRSARFNQTGVSLLMLHYQQSDYAQKIRYYSPNLQLIEKDMIYNGFNKVLKSMNIGDDSLHYLQGLVRSSVKDDDQKYHIARKAYISMLRSYARLPNRQIFAVKKLDLKLLARTFGLNNAKGKKQYNPRAKTSHLQASRKKRKVESVQKLQYSQYM